MSIQERNVTTFSVPYARREAKTAQFITQYKNRLQRQILLLSDGHHTILRIAELLRQSPETIIDIVTRFLQQGIIYIQESSHVPHQSNQTEPLRLIEGTEEEIMASLFIRNKHST